MKFRQDTNELNTLRGAKVDLGSGGGTYGAGGRNKGDEDDLLDMMLAEDNMGMTNEDDEEGEEDIAWGDAGMYSTCISVGLILISECCCSMLSVCVLALTGPLRSIYLALAFTLFSIYIPPKHHTNTDHSNSNSIPPKYPTLHPTLQTPPMVVQLLIQIPPQESTRKRVVASWLPSVSVAAKSPSNNNNNSNNNSNNNNNNNSSSKD